MNLRCDWGKADEDQHSPDCPGLVYHFFPCAENTARKWYRMCNGEARGIDLEEAMAEAVAQLPSIARTYKPERGSVVAVVKPAVWRHLERKFARELRGSTELACEEVPLGEVRADQERAAQLERVQAWAAAAPERAGLLQALDSGRQLTAAQRALFAELRQELGAEVKTAGTWSAARAARYLGLPERTVRELCEAGAVDAVSERGWCVHRRAADKWRRHELAKHLQDGASVRAAAARASASRETARLVLRKACAPRQPGRPPKHDRAELYAALTDCRTAQHTWRNGYPCLSAIAAWMGCARQEVWRAHRKLICQQMTK